MLTETLAIGVFVILTWLGLPIMGVSATGVAFFGMYVVYIPVVYWLARHRTGFKWASSILWHLSLLFAACTVVNAVTTWSVGVGASVGVLAACFWTAHAVTRLSRMSDLGGPLSRLFSRIPATNKADKTKV
jgi:O-antigen/teichoic acid export membrane protein